MMIRGRTTHLLQLLPMGSASFSGSASVHLSNCSHHLLYGWWSTSPSLSGAQGRIWGPGAGAGVGSAFPHWSLVMQFDALPLGLGAVGAGLAAAAAAVLLAAIEVAE